MRYEDSINALKGACLEGQVPGGGACYAYMLRYADEAVRSDQIRSEEHMLRRGGRRAEAAREEGAPEAPLQ